ncbi:MAG: hypothetical protein WCK57_07145 [Verrucomicrobiae bacterium]
MPGKTLFMTAANRDAVLVTRTGNQMRRRALNFADEHAALNWCLDRQATFVLLPKKSNHAQN